MKKKPAQKKPDHTGIVITGCQITGPTINVQPDRTAETLAAALLEMATAATRLAERHGRPVANIAPLIDLGPEFKVGKT
jgi:hypothetical protein